MKRRVGVLELLAAAASQGAVDHLHRFFFTRQAAGVMPQVVSAWARRQGHATFYATWYGAGRAEKLLPDDLDVVFIACHSPGSLVAYALASIYRARGVHTVLGGPHAASFPADAERFFDTVVESCDETVIARLIDDPSAHRGIIATGAALDALPTVEEREPEIRRSAMLGGRPFFATTVPLLSSLGCPYRCDFCIDATRRWTLLPAGDLEGDLEFLESRYPGVRLVFHDPNFAVRFDEVMEVLATRPPQHRLPYAMQASLSILTPQRLPRLAETGCVYTAPSLETFSDYAEKSGIAPAPATERLGKMIGHLQAIADHVPGIQVNLIFGLDQDGDGREHLELSLALMRAVPFALITATIAMPYGGTELHQRLRREGRLLTSLPPAFYYLPDMAFLRPSGDHPEALYDRLIRAFEVMTSREILLARARSSLPLGLKVLHNARALEARRMLKRLRVVRRRLDTDNELRAFFHGAHGRLPDWYRQRARRRLGPYARLLAPDWLRAVQG